jgi:pantothenate kinase
MLQSKSTAVSSEEAHTPISSRFAITWETQIADKIHQLIIDQKTDTKKTFLVAVVGIPGSGKTTSSKILSDALDSQKITNIVMPMDGYHYPLSTLQAMDNANPNDNNFVYRRGAPDTFNSSSLKQDLKNIKASQGKIHIPGFDHAKGDPEPNMYTYDPSLHRVLICEGLYLLHSNDGWKDIGDCFDLSVFIKANVDVCVDRLKVRNLCIPGYTKEEIIVRCDAVDRANAMTVLASSVRADFIMDSMAL